MGVLRIVTDAVEKGICKNLKATLIQDWKTIRNLDSKSHLPGFVYFQIPTPHFFCGDVFGSIDPFWTSAATAALSR